MDKQLLDDVIEIAARLNKAQASEVKKLLSHVEENGTDHDDGGSVDTLTEYILNTAIDFKHC